jgi:hypothetical protein
MPVGRRARVALVTALAVLVSGCPREGDFPVAPSIALVSPELDPNLGTFRGLMTWLQTGVETELVLHAMPLDSFSCEACSERRVAVEYQLESGDGVLSFDEVQERGVDDAGFVLADYLELSPDAQALVAAGMLPEAPGIASRNPQATFTFEPESDGSWSGTLVVKSSSDYLHTAVVSLARDATP